MSARDDFAKLHANTSGPSHQGETSRQAQAALDEIDRLRAEIGIYAVWYREVAKVYDHITGGRISKPETDSVHVIAEADWIVECRIADAVKEAAEADQ